MKKNKSKKTAPAKCKKGFKICGRACIKSSTRCTKKSKKAKTPCYLCNGR